MKDRLLQLLTSENMTALKFAEIMEIRPSNVSHILSGRNNPGFDFIARLLRRFPELNPDWVLNGVGDMHRVGFKHNFSAMGDESADETAVVATLFSNEEPEITTDDSPSSASHTSIEPLNAPQVDFPAPDPDVLPNAVSAPLNALAIEASTQNKPGVADVRNSHTNSEPAQNNPGRLVVNDAQQAEKLVIIYADNTFEVLTPRSR